MMLCLLIISQFIQTSLIWNIYFAVRCCFHAYADNSYARQLEVGGSNNGGSVYGTLTKPNGNGEGWRSRTGSTTTLSSIGRSQVNGVVNGMNGVNDAFTVKNREYQKILGIWNQGKIDIISKCCYCNQKQIFLRQKFTFYRQSHHDQFIFKHKCFNRSILFNWFVQEPTTLTQYYILVLPTVAIVLNDKIYSWEIS